MNTERAAVLERWQARKRLEEQQGPLVCAMVASAILGVTRQRVGQLLEAGRLKPVARCAGLVLLRQQDVLEFAARPRKAGRPRGWRKAEAGKKA